MKDLTGVIRKILKLNCAMAAHPSKFIKKVIVLHT